MASLIDLRRKIRGVVSTRRVTNAMKIVAATKVRRAQEALFNLRPYAWRMRDVLKSLASRTLPEHHPLLRIPEEIRSVDVVVVTADKGLCGAFNQNIIRKAEHFIRGLQVDRVRVHCIGRKGFDAFHKMSMPLGRRYTGIFRHLRYNDAVEIADPFIEAFIAGESDSLFMVYNEYKSALVQNLTIEPLFPLERFEPVRNESLIEYIYEPEPEQLFAALLPRHVHIQFYRIFLESLAAEHSARMIAMDSATKNADNVIHDLTLVLNKTRQAQITKEILEVVNAAEALRG